MLKKSASKEVSLKKVSTILNWPPCNDSRRLDSFSVNICQYLFLDSSQWSVERSEPLSVGRRRHQVVLGGCQPEINQPTDKSPSCNITYMQISVHTWDMKMKITYNISNQTSGWVGRVPATSTQLNSAHLGHCICNYVNLYMGYIIYYIRPGLITPSWTLSTHKYANDIITHQ